MWDDGPWDRVYRLLRTNRPPALLFAMTKDFDPNAAATRHAGVFGLPTTRNEASVVLTPVPFDATTSYRTGTAAGPEAIRVASQQIDLFDHRFGRIYEHGIWMEPHAAQIKSLSMEVRKLTQPLLEKGGATLADSAVVEQINDRCNRVLEYVRSETQAVLAAGKIPGLIGGEHAVSLGAIQAVAAHHGQIGILLIDAHMDLRVAYEGFEQSHASIMHNVLATTGEVSRVVQVGIRDYCEEERDAAAAWGERVRVHYWSDIEDAMAMGDALHAQWLAIIEELPERVYISCDIDGLDPALCPHTGTPVPGGLRFEQAGLLLDLLSRSGRQIVGFDLVEVAPGPVDAPEWDANVGARMVYRLCGAACSSA